MFDYDNMLVKIEPNQSFYIVFEVNWPDIDEYSQNGVYYEITQTVTFPWQQYNN